MFMTCENLEKIITSEYSFSIYYLFSHWLACHQNCKVGSGKVNITGENQFLYPEVHCTLRSPAEYG